MEKTLRIALNILNNHEILGKESLTINEVREILYDVDKMFNFNIETDVKKDFATKEQREVFKDIMSKITGTKTDEKYPDSVFYMVDNFVYMEQDLKTDCFYIRYDSFWRVFKWKLNLNDKEISELLCGLLEEHLKCKVNTTKCDYTYIVQTLEEHLKCKVNTTLTPSPEK